MPFIGDDPVEVYDYISAHTILPGDQIFINNDLVEVVKVIDNGPIFVSGYSHIDGDKVDKILDPDTEVGLWTV